MEQRSAEWSQVRLGKITASEMATVLSGSVTAKNEYLHRLRELQAPMDLDHIPAIQWGRKHEDMALFRYELDNNIELKRPSFLRHPEHRWIGCSPDAVVLPAGGVEVKCPLSPEVHEATLKHGMNAEHMPQVQTCIWCCEADWWDFVSFDPRQHFARRLYVQRIPRDEKFIADMEAKCLEFRKIWQAGEWFERPAVINPVADALPQLF